MPVNTSNAVQAATTAQVASAAVNLGAIGAGAGAFFGIPVLALMIGAFIGTLVHARKSKEGLLNVAWGILTSMFLAGTLTPITILALTHKLSLTAAWEQPLNIAVPVFIGGGWSWALPLVTKVAEDFIGSWRAKMGAK